MELGDGHRVQQALKHFWLPTIARQPRKPHTQSQTSAGVSEALVALRVRHSARLGGIMAHCHDSAGLVAYMHRYSSNEGCADSAQHPPSRSDGGQRKKIVHHSIATNKNRRG